MKVEAVMAACFGGKTHEYEGCGRCNLVTVVLKHSCFFVMSFFWYLIL